MAVRSKTSVRIYISAEDIYLGVRYNNRHCPIAKSLKRNGFPHASVGYPSVDFGDGVGLSERGLTSKACAFVAAFDDSQPVYPTHLTLKLPEPKAQ